MRRRQRRDRTMADGVSSRPLRYLPATGGPTTRLSIAYFGPPNADAFPSSVAVVSTKNFLKTVRICSTTSMWL